MGFIILFALLIMGGAWTLPFVFESSTMFYKFGLEKMLLRWGKVAGITAAVMLYSQVLFVSRFKIFDNIFSLKRMYTFHRRSGLAIALLLALHPILVLSAEGFTLFPLEKRYWPEFLGIGLAMVVMGIVLTGKWRLNFGFSHSLWIRFHRVVTPLAIGAVSIHILFVSETFTSGLPRWLVLLTTGLNMLLILRIWYLRVFSGKRK
jgi:predicted ferric reductase